MNDTVDVTRHLLFPQPVGQISGWVGAAQWGSQAAQHAVLHAGQVIVQLVQLLSQGGHFGIQCSRRHWG